MPILSAQVSVTTAITALVTGAGSLSDPIPAIITNQDGTNSVFIGGSAVTTSNGYELKAGKTISVTLPIGDILSGVTASATVRCDVLKGRS